MENSRALADEIEKFLHKTNKCPTPRLLPFSFHILLYFSSIFMLGVSLIEPFSSTHTRTQIENSQQLQHSVAASASEHISRTTEPSSFISS